MYIKEIAVENYKLLENVTIGSFEEPSDNSELIVLAGANGSGKSSILELLANSLAVSWSLTFNINTRLTDFSYTVELGLTASERKLVTTYIEEKSSPEQFMKKDISGWEDFEKRSTYSRYFASSHKGNYPNYEDSFDLFVKEALNYHYNRPIGFFLRADRAYPEFSFQKDSVFQYNNNPYRIYTEMNSRAFIPHVDQYRYLFQYLITESYNYTHQLGLSKRRSLENQEAELPIENPLVPYNDLLDKLFPGFKFVDLSNSLTPPAELLIELPSKKVISFDMLSSGEKEVFFTLAFFLRYNITDSVIVIDEPELHLHPELARKMIRLLKSLKPRNQIWVATHNAEIINEAEEDKRFFFTRDPNTFKVEVIRALDEAGTVKQVRSLLGSSYISINKNVVFIEGPNASLDERVFSKLATNFDNIKFVPIGSSENQFHLSASLSAILESNLGWAKFYLLRDRDFLSEQGIQEKRKNFPKHSYILERHEIENYFLEENLLTHLYESIEGSPIAPNLIRSKLLDIARTMSGEVLFKMLMFRLQMLYQPEDFSIKGAPLRGESVLSMEGNWIAEKLQIAERLLSTKISSIENELKNRTDFQLPGNIFEQCKDEIKEALFGSNNNWKVLFPGKELLSKYAQQEHRLTLDRFTNLLLNQISGDLRNSFSELSSLLTKIANGQDLE